MEVKIYKRKTDCSQLLESLSKDTDLVKVQALDYDAEPIVRKLDFEDRILGDKESILSNTKKLLGIIDIELFMQNHMYNIVNSGDIIEFSENRFIKTDQEYLPAEIK